MGKQTEAIKVIKQTFDNCQELESVDLDYHESDENVLKVTTLPYKGKYLPDNFSKKVEIEISKVFSGKKQIEKMVQQRWTREDL